MCNKVPIEEVQAIFRRTSPLTLDSIRLNLTPDSDKIVPADIFGNKRADILRIQYSAVKGRDTSNSLRLQVDPNAFRFTKNYTTKFMLDTLDCSALDFRFLSEFTQLTNLTIYRMENMALCLQNLTKLPQTLTNLEISYPNGMNELTSLPTLTNGLKVSYFWGFPLSDPTRKWNVEVMDKILDWVLNSSADTLHSLSFCRMNLLTEVPSQIVSFKALNKVWLKYNKLSTIKIGSFSFKVPVARLDLIGNGITEIESGAFQGKYGISSIIVFRHIQFKNIIFYIFKQTFKHIFSQ